MNVGADRREGKGTLTKSEGLVCTLGHQRPQLSAFLYLRWHRDLIPDFIHQLPGFYDIVFMYPQADHTSSAAATHADRIIQLEQFAPDSVCTKV